MPIYGPEFYRLRSLAKDLNGKIWEKGIMLLTQEWDYIAACKPELILAIIERLEELEGEEGLRRTRMLEERER